jgi:ubiquinone/menaquinone biosynthesis C-methylase UbiE
MSAPPQAAEGNRWSFHDTPEPLTRFLRDRRQNRAVQELLRQTDTRPEHWDRVLVVCGGVGGEGTFLRKQGFRNVTVSEFDPALLRIMGQRDRSLRGAACDAQHLPFAGGSFDLVLVQDGIHHLKNPALGITEMLRVARRAVVVIEPHDGVVARLLGIRIEREGGQENFVFRWNRRMFVQVVSSFLVGTPFHVCTLRFWDHSLAMLRLFRWLPGDRLKLLGIQIGYGVLKLMDSLGGNMFVGIVIMRDDTAFAKKREDG